MFKDRLREVREDRNITQVQMASILNMSSTGYGSYERGETEPNILTLQKICKILNVSSDYLLGINRDTDYVKSFSNDLEILTQTIEEIKKKYK